MLSGRVAENLYHERTTWSK